MAIRSGMMTREEARARAVALYQILQLPDPERIGELFPHQVSGGQLQRLMAAMALCPKPTLLVLDEPTTALDVTTQVEALRAFKTAIQLEHAAGLFVGHDLAVVAQMADRIIVMRNGLMKEDSATERLISAPQDPYTRRLIAAVEKPILTRNPIDRQAQAVLDVQAVSASYGDSGVLALQNVDLTIRSGECVAVIGESGSGKSTLARVIAGLLAPSSGTVSILGEQTSPRLEQRTRDQLRRTQIVFQMADTALNPTQTVGEILSRPLEFYHSLRGAPASQRVAELLSLVELDPILTSRLSRELSGGQKQRVNLARALAAEPVLLICDEVTSGLDTIVAASVVELLAKLRREIGIALMFITHDLGIAAQFADEIAVMRNGRVVEVGGVEQILERPQHPYTQLLKRSTPILQVGWLESLSVDLS